MSSEEFFSNFRVYYEDTDAAGVVYHANYLNFMERARTDWFASLGYKPQQPKDLFGIIFAVRSACLDFIKPAKLGDLLRVSVTPDSIRGASMTISQTISGERGLLVRGSFRIASLDAVRLTVRRIPADLKQRMT